MLDRSHLLKQLQSLSEPLFVDHSDEYDLMCRLWELITKDPLFKHKVQITSLDVTAPRWHDELARVIPVNTPTSGHRVIGVDGSQIYPDKHQGTNCYLINVGTIILSYGMHKEKPFIYSNKPTVFTGEESTLLGLTPELVNCRRQEYEFKELLDLGNHYASPETVFLFDGSLIFWHLNSQDPQLKHTFLSCYLAQMQQMYEKKMLIAGYISLPKSKDLISLIRIAIHECMVPNVPRNTTVDHMVDAVLAGHYLRPYTRTILFQHSSALSASYPEHMRPYFFYMDVGDEIARIEIPAWVVRDETAVERVASAILDQCLKGRGYPVALAEAHEQAVIKGPDREFFYHVITKIGIEERKRVLLSQKSMKKRGILI